MLITYLYRLRPDVKVEDFLSFMREKALPQIRAFAVVNSDHLLHVEDPHGASSVQFIETVDAQSWEALQTLMATDAFKAISSSFRQFVDVDSEMILREFQEDRLDPAIPSHA